VDLKRIQCRIKQTSFQSNEKLTGKDFEDEHLTDTPWAH